jgi:rubrerythrin
VNPEQPWPSDLRALAASAWSFRWRVELEAEARFARLADRLERAVADPRLVRLARRAAGDERRHARRCAAQAAAHGAPVSGPPPPPPEVAPSHLPRREALLYELVAACCVAESGSVAVLTSLLAVVRAPALRAVLHELTVDEVDHARLGWAWLASEHRRGANGFLGPYLPAMLEGSVDEDLFDRVDPARNDPRLLQSGVLPQAARRDLWVRTLAEVIFPGLEGVGVDTGPGRAWLARRLQTGSATAA